MVSNKLIAEVLKNWGLEDQKVTDIVFPETGEISDTSKFVGDEYVIKYTANLGNTKKAIEIAKAMENVGLSAPSVIPAKDGKDYIADGELFFTLTRKIEGERVMASGMYLEDYASKARFIGEITGWLDNALAKIDTAVEEADLTGAVKDWALPKVRKAMELDDAFEDKYIKTFESLYADIPRQVIHRDPNPSNILVAEDKWGFIDFELSERNARIYDPCYAATAILSETFEDGNEEKFLKWIEVMKEIVLGYDSVVKMSESEFKAVPYVILANQFVATAYFSDKDKYQELYETNLKMTKCIVKHFEKMAI